MQRHGACGSGYCDHKGHDMATCGHTSCEQVTYHTYDCAAYLERLRTKHPERFPLCVVLLAGGTRPKTWRFLAKKTFTVRDIMCVVRRRIPDLTPEQGIYMLTLNKALARSDELVTALDSKTTHGLCVLYVAIENTFGFSL